MEVRNKLYDLGCITMEVNEHIAKLIEAGLLNEERYARSYARGRFKMKQWGKRKIIQQLKAHQISEYCIKKALKEIDVDEYMKTLHKLAEKKWQGLCTEKSKLTAKAKLYRYLIQKGYENDLVQDVINELIK